jgi:hypothetical protein
MLKRSSLNWKLFENLEDEKEELNVQYVMACIFKCRRNIRHFGPF